MLVHIEEIDIFESKEWAAYAVSLSFMDANKVSDPALKTAVLLSSCGGP
ncbi:hypothetical protein T4D_2007, partial [Trichinella pseudospiralis]